MTFQPGLRSKLDGSGKSKLPTSFAPALLLDRSSDQESPHAAILIGARGRKHPVIMLVDWSRSSRVAGLALSIFTHHVRRLGGDAILCKDVTWLLHYPKRTLPDLTDLFVLLRISAAGLDGADLELWGRVITARLYEGKTVEDIAVDLQLRPSRVNEILRLACRALTKTRMPNNPLQPFRFGPALWGAFQLRWDSVGGEYAAAGAGRLTDTVRNRVSDILDSLHLSPSMPELVIPESATKDAGEQDSLLADVFHGADIDAEWELQLGDDDVTWADAAA